MLTWNENNVDKKMEKWIEITEGMKTLNSEELGQLILYAEELLKIHIESERDQTK